MKPQIMRLKINKILLTVFFMFFVSVVFSQTHSHKLPQPQDAMAETSDGPSGPPGLPIDGGLAYLVIAGAVFGAYKLRKKK